MFDVDYFLGDVSFDASSMMVSCRFNDDLICLASQGYLLDFFNKFAKNNFSFSLMNCRFKDSGDEFYSVYGKCIAERFGKDIINSDLKDTYFAVYGILLNLCWLCDYNVESVDCEDTFVTVNTAILDCLINSNKVILSKEEYSGYLKHLSVSDELVDAGLIPVLCFKQCTKNSYCVSKDFLDLVELSTHKTVLIPYYLVYKYMKSLMQTMFLAKKVRITYMQNGVVKYINTHIAVLEGEDTEAITHYFSLFNVDAYKTGSLSFVNVDVFQIIDIKVIE